MLIGEELELELEQLMGSPITLLLGLEELSQLMEELAEKFEPHFWRKVPQDPPTNCLNQLRRWWA